MKKSIAKKLELSKETLRDLERASVGKVAGGSAACTFTNCCSGQNTCATCEQTCTSVYC
jgi:hypothetical protein